MTSFLPKTIRAKTWYWFISTLFLPCTFFLQIETFFTSMRIEVVKMKISARFFIEYRVVKRRRRFLKCVPQRIKNLSIILQQHFIAFNAFTLRVHELQQTLTTLTPEYNKFHTPFSRLHSSIHYVQYSTCQLNRKASPYPISFISNHNFICKS